MCMYYEWWCVLALSAILEICTGKWPVASCYFGSGVTHVHVHVAMLLVDISPFAQI